MSYPQQPWQQSAPPQYPVYPPVPGQPHLPGQSPEELRAFALNEIKHGRGHRLPGRPFSRYMTRVWIYAAGSATILLLYPALAVFLALTDHEGDRSGAWWTVMLCAIAAMEVAASVIASFSRRNPVLYPAVAVGVAASASFLLLTTAIVASTRSGWSAEGSSWYVMLVSGMFSFGLVERIAGPLRVPGYTANW